MKTEVIEAVLVRNCRDQGISRVINVEAEPAVEKGENYLSIVTRLKLTVILNSGRVVKRSLILKENKADLTDILGCVTTGIFKAETVMYTTVLKEMQNLMEEFEDTDEVLWCNLVDYQPYSTILLEDLKASGFRTVPRKDCLDLDHGLLTLRSLGRLHGMAKVLEERGIISKSDRAPYVLASDKFSIKCFLYEGLQFLSKAVEQCWGPEWQEIAQRLKVPFEEIQEKMANLVKVDDSRFNVLNHGDCWSSNFLFKYDTENRPCMLRIVDYQLVHYNSCCWDVTHILYVALHESVRREHYNTLVSAYVNSLQKTLEKFKFKGVMPKEESILEDLDRLSYFGLIFRLGEVPIVSADATDVMDGALIFKTAGAEGRNMKYYSYEALHPKIGLDLKYVVEKGII